MNIQQPVKFIALGDSYTIGERVNPKARWPMQLTVALRRTGLNCNEPIIIAKTGWRTDELKHAIKNANLPHDYTLVSLLIGVNDYYQGKRVEHYAADFETLLHMAIRLAGDNTANVFVLSIPDYGYTPFGKSNQPAISKGIDAYNRINQNISAQYGISYIDITDISRQGLKNISLLADDGLHPSGAMYKEWVTQILRVIVPGKK